MRGLIAAASHAVDVAQHHEAREMIAFATQAVRQAPNGAEVCQLLADEAGVTVEQLTGEDEARFTFLAARRWFGWSGGRLLVLDIGGGSLEIAYGIDEEPDAVASLPLGAGRLTAGRVARGPPGPGAHRAPRPPPRAPNAPTGGGVARLRAPPP